MGRRKFKRWNNDLVGLFQNIPPFEILIKCSLTHKHSGLVLKGWAAIGIHQQGTILWYLDQSTLEAGIGGFKAFPTLPKKPSVLTLRQVEIVQNFRQRAPRCTVSQASKTRVSGMPQSTQESKATWVNGIEGEGRQERPGHRLKASG